MSRNLLNAIPFCKSSNPNPALQHSTSKISSFITSSLFPSSLTFCLSSSFSLTFLFSLFLWLLSSGLLGHLQYVGGFEHIGWMTIRAWLICAKIDGDQWDAAEEITPFLAQRERWGDRVNPNTSSVIDHNCTARTHL